MTDDVKALIDEARAMATAYRSDERDYWTDNDRASVDADTADIFDRLAAALEGA